MATKIIHTCDRCGKECNVSKCALHTNYLSDRMYPYADTEKAPREVELCVGCMNDIVKEMRGEQ